MIINEDKHLEETKVRLWCHHCQKYFVVKLGEVEKCPECKRRLLLG